ncbi:MAG: preprotein translocase subunit SecE [Clostridia bacterium]|nr:preprotein translocase subunit SecE [Clostridia bacterium]
MTEYKGELKKITWPTFPVVLRNTVIVLILCAVVGIFIWAEDFGLGKLLELIFG